MNAKELLTLLGLPTSQGYSKDATRLIKVYDFLKSIKNDITESSILEYGIDTDFGLSNQISVKTKTGNYSFAVPCANSFYYSICDLIGLDYEVNGVIKDKPLDSVIVYSEKLKDIIKALKFISKDNLRPSMQCVLLAIDSYTFEIVATDTHRLYMNQKTESSNKERIEILLNATDAKRLAAMKFDYELTELEILEGNKLRVQSEIFDIQDENYPNYRSVIPEYKTFMEFDRKEMNGTIKEVLPYANKVTNEVNFYMNGNIQLSSKDVDFSFDCERRMSYISKNFKDSTISFNGKFFLDSLNLFKNDTLKMYTEGSPTKCSLITNDIETVLLMPIMAR